MTQFQNAHSTDSRLLSLVARPRFLRAIPSVLLLTTAMAWNASSHAAAPGHESGLRSGAATTLAAGHVKAGAALDEGVRLGANDNVSAEQRAAAMQVAQGTVGAGADAGAAASGSLNSATSGMGRAVGGARATGQAAGGTAAPMGESAVGGVRSDAMGPLGGMNGKSGKNAKADKGDKGEVAPDETGGLKGKVGSVPKKLGKTSHGGAAGSAKAGVDADLGAGAAAVNADADVKAGAGIKGKSASPY